MNIVIATETVAKAGSAAIKNLGIQKIFIPDGYSVSRLRRVLLFPFSGYGLLALGCVQCGEDDSPLPTSSSSVHEGTKHTSGPREEVVKGTPEGEGEAAESGGEVEPKITTVQESVLPKTVAKVERVTRRLKKAASSPAQKHALAMESEQEKEKSGIKRVASAAPVLLGEQAQQSGVTLTSEGVPFTGERGLVPNFMSEQVEQVTRGNYQPVHSPEVSEIQLDENNNAAANVEDEITTVQQQVNQAPNVSLNAVRTGSKKQNMHPQSILKSSVDESVAF